jgi:hypothetical protein
VQTLDYLTKQRKYLLFFLLCLKKQEKLKLEAFSFSEAKMVKNPRQDKAKKIFWPTTDHGEILTTKKADQTDSLSHQKT